MRIFLSFLILLFCVSCSQEINENAAMEDGASISFDTSWGKDVQTRGNEMVYHSIFKIGIFAKTKSDGDWQDGESLDPSSFMNNVNFFRSWVSEKNDWSKWDYTPHHYWPENENQKINFFAYAPRRDSASLNLADNHVRLYHSTSKENVDLVWACSLNQNKSTVSKSENKAVELQFKHSLAKISFRIGLSEPLDGDADKGAQVILKSVKLCDPDGTGGVFIDGGYLNLATGEWNLDDPLSPRKVYTWTTPETDTNNKKDFLLSSDKINYENIPITVSDKSYLFILPQTKFQPFYLIVDYVLKHADGMEEQRQAKGLVNVNSELPMKFVAGKAYNFVLNIPLNRIQVDVDTNVEGWTSTTKTRAAEEEEGTNTGISEFTDGSKLGLFAFHAENSTTASELFMSKLNNTKVGEELTYQASDKTWNYSPKRFWPQTGILHFYAGYPYFMEFNENGKARFKTPDYNPFGVDFLWGLCNNVECSSHPNPVKIKMKHALARVNIYFEDYGDVNNVKVAASREGTFISTSPEGIPIWKVDQSKAKELVRVHKKIEDPAAILFVFPGKINELSFYSSLKKETIDLPNFDTDSPEFEAGKEYNINVSPSRINYDYVPPK